MGKGERGCGCGEAHLGFKFCGIVDRGFRRVETVIWSYLIIWLGISLYPLKKNVMFSTVFTRITKPVEFS
jgi:hypothetical protein